MEGIAMAPGSESAAEKVGPRWEVGPTEDVVQALMETLVDPVLPLRVSCTPPSEDIQIAVAKQMHAVVLLYNYHHRKQKPELVFLEFVKFCKLAIVIRPPLIKFMKLMKESKLQELNGKYQLSLTEEAIKDACNIALGLDASKDVPNMEGWPISKVAVLLIDSKKENCMLQFDAVTQGAWSLFEKELSESSSITPEISAGDKVGSKRKRDNLKVSTYNTEFLQLGYDAVKDMTGISISDLEVLETHMTFSLSKEKSAACFYIMQCHGPFNEHDQLPLKFLAESVQGPLAEKVADGSWKTTPLVKLYHMLAYTELILSSLSGCETEVNSSDQKASYVDIHEKDGNINNKFVKRFDFLDSAESTQNGILENLADGSEQADKCLSSSPSRSLSEMVMEVDNAMEESGKGCDMSDPTAEVASRITVENPDTESNEYDPVSGLSKGLFGKTVVDDSERKILDEKHDVGHSAEKDERRMNPEKLDEDGVGCGKDTFSGPPRVLETTNINGLTEICTDTEDNKMPNATIKVYHYRRKKNSSLIAQLKEDVPGLKVDTVDALESKHTQRKDEKVSGDEGCLTNTCNQTGTASTARRDEKVAGDEGYLTNSRNQTGTASNEDQQAQLEAEIKPNAEIPSTLDSFRSDHIQSIDEKLSGGKGDLTQECNHTGIAFAASRNQLAQVEAKSKHDLGANTTSGSDHLQNSLAKENSCDHTGTASKENQQAQLKAEIKPNAEVQSTLGSFSTDHIQSIDEKLSRDKGDLTRECNHTGIAFTASRNQLAQVEAKSKHDLGADTTSGSDHLQNALALLYRKRREVYSQICNMEDKLALCEDNVARIREGGEVDLARQCIESVISGQFDSLMENGTQVQNKDSQQNCKSQHGKTTKLSEAYLAGKSSCQDLEYTCVKNNWRMPRYLTESSDGKFMSNVVVEGKDFKLHAKGGLESNPCEARENAAAHMITILRHEWFVKVSTCIWKKNKNKNKVTLELQLYRSKLPKEVLLMNNEIIQIPYVDREYGIGEIEVAW